MLNSVGSGRADAISLIDRKVMIICSETMTVRIYYPQNRTVEE